MGHPPTFPRTHPLTQTPSATPLSDGLVEMLGNIRQWFVAATRNRGHALKKQKRKNENWFRLVRRNLKFKPEETKPPKMTRKRLVCYGQCWKFPKKSRLEIPVGNFRKKPLHTIFWCLPLLTNLFFAPPSKRPLFLFQQCSRFYIAGFLCVSRQTVRTPHPCAKATEKFKTPQRF